MRRPTVIDSGSFSRRFQARAAMPVSDRAMYHGERSPHGAPNARVSWACGGRSERERERETVGSAVGRRLWDKELGGGGSLG